MRRLELALLPEDVATIYPSCQMVTPEFDDWGGDGSDIYCQRLSVATVQGVRACETHVSECESDGGYPVRRFGMGSVPELAVVGVLEYNGVSSIVVFRSSRRDGERLFLREGLIDGDGKGNPLWILFETDDESTVQLLHGGASIHDLLVDSPAVWRVETDSSTRRIDAHELDTIPVEYRPQTFAEHRKRGIDEAKPWMWSWFGVPNQA